MPFGKLLEMCLSVCLCLFRELSIDLVYKLFSFLSNHTQKTYILFNGVVQSPDPILPAVSSWAPTSLFGKSISQ